MTTTYAAVAAPKWRVMPRRSLAVRGTSKNALQAAARVRLFTPHQWAEWRLQGSRYSWRESVFDKYFDVHRDKRDGARNDVLEFCETFIDFNPRGASLTSRELLARGEDWLNRHPVRHLPIESCERQRWNWVDSVVTLFKFRIRELARAHWRLVRGLILKRIVVFYWQEQTQRALCAPGGAGRVEDRAAFESEFA